MNGKNLLGIVFIVLMVTSGPLYLPLVIATTNTTQVNSTDTNNQLTNQTNIEPRPPNNFTVSYNYTYQDPLNQTQTPQETHYSNIPLHNRPKITKPKTQLTTSQTEGQTPIKVTHQADFEATQGWNPLIYLWDFDGDGVNEYSTYTNKATKVYTAEKQTTYNPKVTIRYTNGYSTTAETSVTVKPREWIHRYQNYHTFIDVDTEGNTYIYDQNNLLPITLTIDNQPLPKPVTTSDLERETTLTYETNDTIIQVNIKYGLTGRAYFNITETLKPETDKTFEDLPQTQIPEPIKKGRLSLTVSITKTDSTHRTILFDAGNSDPWTDQGLTPYGDYFSNLNEYVSMQTGYLTVIQTDQIVPGRGLDLVLKRVHAPPSDFDENQPADVTGYSYQAYPWAPMGNGWELGFPWLETNSSGLAYIRLGNGQRYEWEGDGASGTEYHIGDQFELFKHAGNSSYTLITAGGIRYDYDSSYKPTTIKDNTRNSTISFSYTSNKITTITDPIGRTASLSYGGTGQVSTITIGSKTLTYTYETGDETGYKLVSVSDPLGRKTNYTYSKDFLLTHVQYPTGGYTAYDYNSYNSSTYFRYRIKSQNVYDGNGSYVSRRYIYDGGYSTVDETKIIELFESTTRKTTIMEYISETVKTETVYNGTSSDARIYKEHSTLSNNKLRKDIAYYPGNNAQSFNSTFKYDNWHNLIYSINDYGYEKFYSFENTNTTDKFYYSNGTQVTTFSDKFYTNSIPSTIHNRKTGVAHLQNGTGSSSVENYFNYDNAGSLITTKSLLDTSWVNNSYTYDIYGNLVTSTDANDNSLYNIYDGNNTYLVETRQPVNPSSNVTTIFGYNQTTGELINSTDQNGNTYKYEYDLLGRITKITNPAIDTVTTYKEAVYNDTVTFSSVESSSDIASDWYTYWFRTHTFQSEGRTWVFSYDITEDDIEYTSSVDNDNWETDTAVPYTSDDGSWNLYYDGEYVHLVHTESQDRKDLYYKRGNPNPDGTITWQNSVKAYDVGSRRAQHPCITVTDNYVWISFQKRSSSTDKDLYVTCSSDMDGGWSTRSGFPTQMSDEDYHQYSKLAPLTGDKLYLVWNNRWYVTGDLSGYLWDGSSWGTLEIIQETIMYSDTFDVTSWGNDVYLFHQDDDDGDPAVVRKRDYLTGSWSNGDAIFTPTLSGHSVQIARGQKYGTLYAFYAPTNGVIGVYYRYYNGTVWTSAQSFVLDNDANYQRGSLSADEQAFDGQISFVYNSGGSPRNIESTFFIVDDLANPSSTKIIDENSNYVTNYYNGIGYLTKHERYNNTLLYSTENYAYNWQNLLETTTIPSGYNYTYYYDTVGNPIRIVNPDQTSAQTIYDYVNNRRTVLDEEGRKRTLHYDWLNRLVQVDEYNTSSTYYTTEYRYDSVGNLLNLTDALGRETGYVYDQFNRLTRIDYPDSSYESYTYDDVGSMLTKLDQNGNTTIYVYDSLNRLINETFPDNTEALYTYNNNSLIQSSSYNGTITSYQYDARNRVTQESVNVSGTVHTVDYSYDNSSRVDSLTYPDSSIVTYTYDGLGRVDEVTGYAEFNYNVNDLVETINYQNGVETTYTYDNMNRPTNIEVNSSSSTIMDLSYGYDKTGSVTWIHDGTNNETYSYDLLDRLTYSNGTFGTLDYVYDPVGNRLSKTIRGGSGDNQSLSYDSMNQITGSAFDWDSNGNMLYRNISSNSWDYTYDMLNRLKTVSDAGDFSAIYTYDGGGRRVRSWDAVDGSVDYVYSGLQIIDEIDGGVHEKHVYAGMTQIASNTTDTIEYYHADHLGSTRLKTVANGSAIYESNYEPYGSGSGEDGSEDYRFTGKHEDPSGLYYFGDRYYDPLVGRFTTRDTFPGFRSNPQSLNQYVYCQNNPHKYNDPTGNFFEPISFTLGSVVIGGSLLFGALFPETTVQILSTIGNTVWNMFSTAPSGTSSVSDGIEQYREQAGNSYGVYSGTSNPSTVMEQTQSNGITNNSDDQGNDNGNNRKKKSSFESGWFDDEGKQHSTWTNSEGNLREYVGWIDDGGNLHQQRISHRQSGYRSVMEFTWNVQGQTETVWHYVYDQLGYLTHIDLKYKRVPDP